MAERKAQELQEQEIRNIVIQPRANPSLIPGCQAFLASGDFLWNAGIFVWETQAVLAALRQQTRDAVLFRRVYNTPSICWYLFRPFKGYQ